MSRAVLLALLFVLPLPAARADGKKADAEAVIRAVKALGGEAAWDDNRVSDEPAKLLSCHLPDGLTDAKLKATFPPTDVPLRVQAMNSDLTADGVAFLAANVNLVTLELYGRPVDDRIGPALGRCKTLQYLNLSHSKVTDKALPSLANCTALRRLDLNGTAVTDNGMKAVAKLPALREVELQGTGITDAGFSSLSGAAELQTVNLSRSKVTLEKWAGKFSKLESLGLLACPLTDAGLKSLANAPNLKKLYLKDTPITDAGAPALAALSKLELLWVSDTKMTATGFAAIRAKLPNCRGIPE